VQGSVKVKLATPTGLSLVDPGKRKSEDDPKPTIDVWVGKSPEDGKMLQVVSAKVQEPRGNLLVKFEGISDRTTVEKMLGLKLFAPASRRAALEQGEFFVEDMIGLTVTTDKGRSLGTLIEVTANPASDIYETSIGALIPAVKEFVLKIDFESRSLLVKDIPGLIPEEQEAVEGEGQNDPPVDDNVDSAAADTLEPAKTARRRFRVGSKR
jgi:16S rRNA processing protein RimM